MYCPKCNKKYKYNEKFCYNCGEALVDSFDELIEKPKIQKFDKTMFIISIIAAIVSIMPIFKTIMIIGLIFGVGSLVYGIIKYVKQKQKIHSYIIIANVVNIICNILWIIFAFDVYDKLL